MSAATVVAYIETEPDGFWTLLIDTASDANTFCFEASTNGRQWVPINANRHSGPGPRLGNIQTNAVQGGPARFTGHAGGFTHIRVVRTRSDNSFIYLSLTSDKPREMYIIDEEMTLEDALKSF